MTDTQLLDALERFIDNNGGLLIHNGGHDSKKFLGLGLRSTNRTLRQALLAIGLNPENAPVKFHKSSAEAKTE